MKKVAIAGAAVVIVGAAVWWGPRFSSRTANVPSHRNAEPPKGSATKAVTATRAPLPMEPILVLPDVETAPLPVQAVQASLPAAPIAMKPGPRPEIGRDARPWMPYAPEDVELAATRRLDWAKVLVQDGESMPRAFHLEETQEPPLLEPVRR